MKLNAILDRIGELLDRLPLSSGGQGLSRAGMGVVYAGFFGFCLFMNSDVLVVNRLFQYVPGIAAITRASVWLDETTVGLPGMSDTGSQVIGVARKPAPA